MARVARSCFVSSWRINHLGMNPVRGGRPPRESRTSGIRAVRIGVFVQEIARALMVVALFILKIRNTEDVIMR